MSTAADGGGAFWELRLLGGLSARWGGAGGRVIERFRSQKAASLLAYLALEPERTHAREELADLFWPDADDVEAARANLRQALATLRRELEGDDAAPPGAAVQADGRAFVRLNPDVVRTDARRFEAALARAGAATAPADALPLLEEAVSLYAGPLLPGVSEPWAAQARARLAAAHLSALDRLCALRAAHGDNAGALAAARRALAADPLSERAHAAVVRLLRVAEGEAAARRHYDEAVRVLGDKLGVAPSPELRAALEGALEGKGSVAPAHTPPAPLPQTSGLKAGGGGGSDAGRDSGASGAATSPTVRLPLTLTRFFGREDEVGRIEGLLRDEAAGVRLVTLTGAGGSGKTRLAVEAARRLAPVRFTGGVHFAPLADLRDGARVSDAVLAALSGPAAAGAARNPAGLPPVELVLAELAGRPGPVLIVLDNAEHLIDDVAGAALELLTRAPNLSLVVTSRQNLGVAGERELPVDPLPVPTLAGSPERLMEFPSVALFVHRAQQVRPDFPYTARTAPTIAALCALLDGIPLAIEIAASWVQTLTPAQMLERLGGGEGGGAGGRSRLDALEWRRRDAPARHATLRSAIAWGFDLLPEDARRFFARLSVFRGGWTLEAAAEIAGETELSGGLPPELLLTELRDRSFIVAEESEDPEGRLTMRYRMLETLREFAEEQLPDEERAALRERHIAYFAGLAEENARRIAGAVAARVLDPEHDNLRAALDRDADPLRRLGMVAHLRQFWADRGHLREGRARAERALADAPAADAPPSLRAAAHNTAGHLALDLHDFDGAEYHFESARLLYADAGDDAACGSVLYTQGVARANRGDLDGARSAYTEALEIARARGDRSREGSLLARFGALEAQRGDREAALPYLEAALEAQRAAGDSPSDIASTLHNLGLVRAHRGDLPGGMALLEEAVTLRREKGEGMRLANSLQTLAALRVGAGAQDPEAGADYDAAEREIREALSLYDRAGTRCLTPTPYLNLAKIAILRDRDPAAAGPHMAQAVRLARERGRADSLMAAFGSVGYLAALAARTAPRRRDAEEAAHRAALLWGVAEEYREQGKILLLEVELRYDAEYAAMARAVIGDEAFDAGRREGRALPAEEAERVALAVCEAAAGLPKATLAEVVAIP
jgi:predicted ATPase/DNA-binding SARP family transcriptional activator